MIVDRGTVYLTLQDDLVAIDDAGPRILADGVGAATSIALVGDDVLLTAGSAIVAVPRAGGAPRVVVTQSSIDHLHGDADAIYWTAAPTGTPERGLFRQPVGGAPALVVPDHLADFQIVDGQLIWSTPDGFAALTLRTGVVSAQWRVVGKYHWQVQDGRLYYLAESEGSRTPDELRTVGRPSDAAQVLVRAGAPSGREPTASLGRFVVASDGTVYASTVDELRAVGGDAVAVLSERPRALAVDAGYVYWMDRNTVRRVAR